jgi:hypothetical protein
MAEGNGKGKSGTPAAKEKKTPSTYVLYRLGEDRSLTFVTSADGLTREDAIQNAVRADSALAGQPLVPIPESRLVQLSGESKTNVKVTPV